MESAFTTAAVITGQSRAGKYLSFQLSREEYAIQVLKVREIMGIQHITLVPRTPRDVKGVLNLRGKVIPVIDLRLKFGLPEKKYSHRTCIIVVQPDPEIATQMGIVVDEVSEVMALSDSDIEDTPDFGGGVQVPYLLGIAKVKGKVKILVDIEEILKTQDLGGLAAILETSRAFHE